MKTIITCAAVAAIGLSGCVTSSGGDTIKALSPERARAASIGDVVLTAAPTTVSGEFAALFDRLVTEELAKCAKGSQPLRLEIRLSELKAANPAMAYLVGDSNVIRGTAVLRDPATGETVGDYEISRSAGGGGLIAAISMAEAEEQMSRAFGAELCKRAFAG
ncbi:hypothetical protein BZG35_00640 [Brevundimonas sp. LM2]|uniref:hypothetical protein n=1 Tax=Brevundimonas sp. LM2 TaxID=1938605 RepID=UPI000983B05F|nr:hypothetical protein [Brevundimonas sp. LM2]AQR60325.1 hypothetical protein BZG35_00640 [Brevundimonas sp. LM2]